MVKITLILLQIILVVSSTVARNIDAEKDGLVYIGSFKSETQQGSGLEALNFDENSYYVSVNPTVWATAEEDCNNIIGPHGGLLSIETLEEWEFLKIILENYGFGSTYWTSGRYNAITSEWGWSNNQPLPPNPPWAEGYPTFPNMVSRVLIYHINRYDANWRTILETQLHRFICEERTWIDKLK